MDGQCCSNWEFFLTKQTLFIVGDILNLEMALMESEGIRHAANYAICSL